MDGTEDRRREGGKVSALLLAVGVLAGGLKEHPSLSWFPVDLTLLAVAGVALLLAGRLLGRPFRVPAFVVVLALLAMPGILFRPDHEYATHKAVGLVATAILAVGAYYLLDSDRRVRAWLGWHLLLGVVILVLAYTSERSDTGRIVVEGANVISTARASGMAIVLLVAVAMFGSRLRVVSLLAAVVLAVPFLNVGSRGPFLAAALAVATLVLLGPRRGRIGRLLLLGTLTIGAAYYIATAQTFAVARIRNSILSRERATGTRDAYWQAGVDALGSHPFGAGLGGFWERAPVGLQVDGYRIYPHNLFLEVGSELGWAVMVCVAAWIGWVVVRLARLGRSHVPAGVLLAMVVFYVTNAMVSGDINDNRTMWTALAVGAATATRLTREARSASTAAHAPPAAGRSRPPTSRRRPQRQPSP